MARRRPPVTCFSPPTFESPETNSLEWTFVEAMKRTLIHLLLLGLFAGACGGESTSTTSETPVASTTTVAATTTTAASTTTSSTTTSTTTTTPSTTIPGEEIQLFFDAGDRLMVIGVSHDDVLNLRELPGTAFDVVGEIPPDYRDLVAVGSTRDIGRSIWTEVDFAGVVGWVHIGFIAFEGVTDDLTAFVVEQMGDRPSAASMTELGRIVAEQFVSEDVQSEVVKVVDETVGDLGEVTFDVVGLADDSVRGVRLHVFGEPFEGGFALRNLEVTYLCGRGVTDEKVCV